MTCNTKEFVIFGDSYASIYVYLYDENDIIIINL